MAAPPVSPLLSPAPYPVGRIAVWQLAATLVISAAAYALGGLPSLVSGFAGGAVNIGAGVAYGILVRIGSGGDAGRTLRTLFRAEAVKIVVLVAGIWLALTRLTALDHLTFMLAFLGTVLLGPLASLRDKENKRGRN